MNAPRKTYPAGVPCWVDTTQPDPDAATDFYGALFGWEFEERTPPGAESRYLVARMRDLAVCGIGTKDPADESPTAWNTYIAVDAADAAAAKAAEAGGTVVNESFDVGEDGRMAVVADRAGAVFCVWEGRDFPGAELVNEPGSWSFNALNTRDRDGAVGFYGEVFGWETSPEEDGMSFWRRPGYGEFLDGINPGTLARAEEMGAPEGFPDAVAWLVKMTDEAFGPGVPSHWSTSFATEDADATAARARELGGEVLVEPTDAPWVRFTVLRDPQGATLTASQFVPPEN